MIRYFKAQIEEIRSQPGLQIYGFFIALVHAITLLMVVSQQALTLYDVPSDILCWPFFSSCQSVSFLTPGFMQGLLIFYGALIILVMAALVLKRVAVAYLFFVALLIHKFILISLSYQFSHSVHFVSQIVLLCWLLVPGKADFLRLILVASSVVFGLHKINQDWLTGAALPEPSSWTSAPLMIFLFLGPLVEVISALALLSKTRAVQSFSFVIFVAWHLVSITFLGLHGPLMMIGLFSLFLINLILWQPERHQLVDQIFAAKVRRSHVVILGIFVCLQVLPLLMTRHPALSAVPSMFALQAPQHRLDCSAMVQYQDERGQNIQSNPFDLENKNLLRCDPLVYLNQMKNLCDRQFIANARLFLFAKHRTGQDFAQILDVAHVCERSNLLWAEVIK